MPFAAASLSKNAITALKAIADGYTYEQILVKHPGLTYLDIFSAARDALDIAEASSNKTPMQGTPKPSGKTLDEYRQTDPRAYEKWSEEEEDALIELMKTGHTIRSAAELLQRKPGAIRSCLEKLSALSTDASTPD